MLDQDNQAFNRPNLNHVIDPDKGSSVIPLEQASDPAPEFKKKSRRGLLIGVTGGLAGAAIAAASIIGINAANEPSIGAVRWLWFGLTGDPEPEKL